MLVKTTSANRLSSLISVALLLAVGLRPAAGQDSYLHGRVLETSGRPILGATLRLGSSDGPIGGPARSDTAGRYRLPLPSASQFFEIRVECAGFYPLRVTVPAAGPSRAGAASALPLATRAGSALKRSVMLLATLKRW